MPYKVIDLHCDSVFHLMEGTDLRQSVPDAHVDLPRLREGGVALQVFAAYVPHNAEEGTAFQNAAEKLDAIDSFARSHELLAPVENAAELESVMAAGKTGIMAAVENGIAIENSLKNLEKLRRRKVRIMTLVHSHHMSWVASCTGKEEFRPEEAGEKSLDLSRFGEKVIDAMCDLGIIPDLSHTSEKGFWDVLRRSKKPVIASHSCAYTLCAALRNLKDDQLKALGDSGGVVGVNFASSFLSEAYRESYERNGRSTHNLAAPPVPLSIVADHIDHMVAMAGEDCIAIGSDFDGVSAVPDGVSGSGFYPVLETELRARGYSEARIEKIFNANFIRLLKEWDK